MSGKYWDITRTAIRGCSHASRGCDHCWAERMAWRLAHNPNKKISDKYAGLVWRDGWNGDTWHDDIWDMGLPKKGKRILFNCMGDLFHKANKPGDIQAVLDRMRCWPQHTFIVPTKRTRGAQYHLKVFRRSMTNMVLLASVEDQAALDDRLPALLECKPHVKMIGLSVEPFLGEIEIDPEEIRKLGWIIIGRETGPGARPVPPGAEQSLLWDCGFNDIPVFHKQGKVKILQEIPI